MKVDGDPSCHADYPSQIGDSNKCHGGIKECVWERGDGILDEYPDCNVRYSSRSGDGVRIMVKDEAPKNTIRLG